MSATMGTFFNWLIRASWQAAVLVLIIFLVQSLFGKKLSARWRHALWLLVVARLLLPAGPHSALSLFNYAGLDNMHGKPPTMTATPHSSDVFRAARAPDGETAGEPQPPSAATESLPGKVYPAPVMSASSSQTMITRPAAVAGIPFGWEKITRLCTLLWGIGAGLLALRVMGQNLAFVRRLRAANSIAEPKTRALFEQCKGLLGIHFSVGLVETSEVTSPALHGFFRPCLLLPAQVMGAFSQQELRYIFLHELAHVKRRDMAVHRAATLLKILHWFNPFIWLGFRRMAMDRELACDELALYCAGERERKPYGAAIIKVLETCSGLPGLPGVMGILEDKDQMTRRISMILMFRQRSRQSVLAVLLLLALGLITLTDARSGSKSGTEPALQPTVPASSKTAQPGTGDAGMALRPDLVGHVHADDGSPVVATVFIYTAGPKVGSSTFCPSCYADCRKHEKSNARGDFKIDSLDPQLFFRILVVAKGYEPKFVGKVDPSTGPVDVKLKPTDARQAGPERTLHGRVIDAKGDPVEGAVVNAHGIRKKDGSAMWGTLSGVDPLAVTDAQGDFVITAVDPFESMDVQVEARALANKTFTKLASGAAQHDLVMTEGVTVTGRVMVRGQPLANVSVGIVSVDRGMENFTGSFDIGTGSDGKFAFMNLPPNVDYYVYGLMKTLKPYGAVPVAKLHAGADGEITDAGDLIVLPAYRLAGRVVLADGQPVPPKTLLLIDRDQAWDSMQIDLAADGSFNTTGIPAGTLDLSVRVPGYSVAPQNASLDLLNPYRLVGRVDGDITNLVFLLAKGKGLDPDYGQNSSLSWNRPLQGSEASAGAVPSFAWAVSGRVTDSDTHEPIGHFRVIPGYTVRNWGQTTWDARLTADGTNGEYTAYLDKRWAEPLLQVKAEGYLPEQLSVLPLQQANADVSLKKGTGPSGVVLLPDGKPAAGAGVLLVCAEDQNMGLDAAGQLRPNNKRGSQIKTDADGHFSFAPEVGMKLLAAAAPEGFKQVPVETLQANPNIVLEPFGRIKGTLKRPSGPGTNEDLDVAFVEDSSPFMKGRINLSNHARTDDQGHFEFDGVPSGQLQITYREPVANSQFEAWSSRPLQQVTLKPDQTLEVNIAAPERARTEFMPGRQIRQPEPSRVPGVQLKGRVFLPNGRPAASAQVALQVSGKYLQLGKALLDTGGNPEDGLIVNTGPTGEFTLPMYDGAESVIALNNEGFAKVSLAEFKASPQITLQAWGCIEGTLHIGRRLGTNQVIMLAFGMGPLDSDPLMYDNNVFQARTDGQGRFVITYVPPGTRKLARAVPIGNGSQTQQTLGSVDVKAGGVTKVSLGGTGETVVGRAKLGKSSLPVDWKNVQGTIHTDFPETMRRLQAMKTPEEQIAYQKTEEYKSMTKTAWKDFQSYPAVFSDDGSFTADEIPPGKYELDIHQFKPGGMPGMLEPANLGHAEISVPALAGNGNATAVDLGVLDLKP